MSFKDSRPLGGVSSTDPTFDYGGTFVDITFPPQASGCVESFVQLSTSNPLLAVVNAPGNACSPLASGSASFFVQARGVSYATPVIVRASGKTALMTVMPTPFDQIDFMTGSQGSSTAVKINAYSSYSGASIGVYLNSTTLLGTLKKTGVFTYSGTFAFPSTPTPFSITLRSNRGACSIAFLSRTTGKFSAFDRCQ
jgi:hypothetical protein